MSSGLQERDNGEPLSLSSKDALKLTRSRFRVPRRLVRPFDLEAGQSEAGEMVHDNVDAQQESVTLSRAPTWSKSCLVHVRSSSHSPPPSSSLTAKIVKDVTQLVLARRTRMCNFLEYKGSSPLISSSPHSCARCSLIHALAFVVDSKIVYRRYASLFFVCGIGQQDNELITLEIIHRYAEPSLPPSHPWDSVGAHADNLMVGVVTSKCWIDTLETSASWICQFSPFFRLASLSLRSKD